MITAQTYLYTNDCGIVQLYQMCVDTVGENSHIQNNLSSPLL